MILQLKRQRRQIKRRFKFEAMWLENSACKEVRKQSWESNLLSSAIQVKGFSTQRECNEVKQNWKLDEEENNFIS